MSDSSEITHLVVIAREGIPEVTEFTSLNDAERFFDSASLQWSESYLTAVIYGPGKPMRKYIAPINEP